jgi:hypothetical protein
VLRTAHSDGFSYQSNCTQHYAVRPAAVALLPICWLVVPSQLQTPCLCGHFLLILQVWLKFVAFILFVPQGRWSSQLLRNVSVVTRFCVCLWSTWQHWITIGPLFTLCRLTVHLGSAHGKGIYLDIEQHCSWMYLPKTYRLIDHSYSKVKRFFGLWPAHYWPCMIRRCETSSTALGLRPI